MTLRLLFPRLLLSLILVSSLQAQTDIAAEYQRLQDAYSQRMTDIEGRLKAAERDLLNGFILSLVRTEQSYRDSGNLDGLVLSRELRETLLQTPVFPQLEDRFPEDLKTMTRSLLQQREELRRNHQKELDDLNRILFTALERFQREYTRAGQFETAIEIRDMRAMLRESLGANLAAPVPSPTGPVVIPTDPNVYPVCVEPGGYVAAVGVSPRVPQIPFQLAVENPERTQIGPKAFALRGGFFTLPAEAAAVLIQQVQQNQMLNVEFALHSTHAQQGSRAVPAPLVVLGNSIAECNLAVTQEGANLFLYLRTTMPPAGQTHHRLNLGPVEAGRAHHLQITYRSGELTVYRNGTETQKIRGSVNGLLSNWAIAPVLLGGLPPAPEQPEPSRWVGNLIQLYIKATLDTSRVATGNFNRFSTFLSR